ncbi:MAG: hypothetical protein OXG49_10065 [Chloroflexi bacterium]|nr:hypothetical protein [Chloroflexota bacterium]
MLKSGSLAEPPGRAIAGCGIVGVPLPDTALLKDKYLSPTVCQTRQGAPDIKPEIAGAPLPDTTVLKDKYLSGTVCERRQAASDIEPEMAGAPLSDTALLKSKYLSGTVWGSDH